MTSFVSLLNNRCKMSLVRNGRRWAGVLLGGAMLASCESRKPAAATTAAASVTHAPPPAQQAVLPDQPQPADTGGVVAYQPTATGDVPALHEPFEDTKQVAPGLRVTINSVRPAATAVIRDPSDLKVVLTITRNDRLIFRDTTADGLTYELFAMPETEKLYPLWVPTGGGNGDLLVAFSNRPSKELARRFCIRHNQVVRVDTLLTFDGPAKDRDHDGRPEFAGFYDFGEEWEDAKGQHRRTYVPTLYYEVRPTGLVLDSALTEKQARVDYGVFLGFKDSGQPGILTSKLPKGSRYRHEEQ